MSDLSATRKIVALRLDGARYSVGTSWFPDCFEKITVEEKNGSMAPVIWYQLWMDGQVEREVNGCFVMEVEYEMIPQGEIPF